MQSMDAHRVMLAALLIATAGVAQSRVVAFGLPDGLGRPEYVDLSGTQPRPVAVSTSGLNEIANEAYLLYPDMQDSTLQRAEQQVELLNSLQSYVLTPRSPCGHAKSARQPQQAPHLVTSTMHPMVVSYMASSRFPSILSSFDMFTQSDDGFLTQHTLSDADSSVRALPQAIHALEVSNEPQEFDELYLQHQADESQETSVVSEGDSTAARVMASAMSDQFSLMDGSLDSADWTALDQEAVGRSSAGDNLSWSIVDDEGNVNWGVLIFSLLCFACGAVWLGLLRTWCALGNSCLSCPRKQRQVGTLLPPFCPTFGTLYAHSCLLVSCLVHSLSSWPSRSACSCAAVACSCTLTACSCAVVPCSCE
ncbi:hypothetical protein ABBQ32_010550 [Trebouxia sp. C0010 RCD-2024]